MATAGLSPTQADGSPESKMTGDLVSRMSASTPWGGDTGRANGSVEALGGAPLNSADGRSWDKP